MKSVYSNTPQGRKLERTAINKDRFQTTIMKHKTLSEPKAVEGSFLGLTSIIV